MVKAASQELSQAGVFKVIGAHRKSEPVEITEGGQVGGTQDPFGKFVGLPVGPLVLTIEPTWGDQYGPLDVPFFHSSHNPIPRYVQHVSGRWEPYDPSAKEKENPVVRIIDPEPDGLYDKYRVFKEPQRDSQGNEPSEHPVSIDPPTWLSHFVNASGEEVDILEQLSEVEEFVFVLKPDSDVHARVAIAAYAYSVRDEKPELCSDLLGVLEGM